MDEVFNLFMVGCILFLTLPLGVALGALAIVARNHNREVVVNKVS